MIYHINWVFSPGFLVAIKPYGPDDIFSDEPRKGTGSTSTAGSAFSGSMLSLDLMQRELPSAPGLEIGRASGGI